MKRVLIIFVSAFALGAAGAGLGYALGRVVPGYYRATFPGGDPIEVGLGLGLSQGVLAGLVVGVVLALIDVWRERRDLRHEQLLNALAEIRKALERTASEIDPERTVMTLPEPGEKPR